MTDTSNAETPAGTPADTPAETPSEPPSSEPPKSPDDIPSEDDAPAASDDEMTKYSDTGFDEADEGLDADIPEEGDDATPPAEGEPAPEAPKAPGEEGDAEAPAAEPKPGEEPAKPAESGEQPAKPDEAKPKEEPAPAPEAKPEGEAPSPEAPSGEPQQQMTPEERARYFGQVRAAAIDGLAESHFKLDDEAVELLQEKPEEFFAKAAAAVYFDAVTQTIATVHQQLPSAIQTFLDSRKVEEASETKFFEEWPQLKEADQGVLGRIAAAYRQQNPQASEETFIKEVGAAAMIALRIPQEGAGAPGTGNGAAAPPAEAPKPQPFAPAGAGGGRGAAPPAPVDPYTQMDQELFEENDELDQDR